MAYVRPTKAEAPSADRSTAPDPAPVVMDGVLTWMRKRGRSSLPAPCPPDPAGCVRWWIEHMQEPEGARETIPAAVLGGDSTRWEEGYATRCRNTLLRFLDLRPVERDTVVAGVVNDRIPYRGEDFKFYVQVHEETLRMRDIGVAAYRDRAQALGVRVGSW